MTDALLSPLGDRVRALRTARGWTLRDLAERSSVSPRFLAQIEAGSGNVSVLRLADVAGALGTTPSALLSGIGRDVRQGPAVVALLGVRGAGKSTIGELLARRLGRPFLELDGLIEQAAGLSLREIFDVHGERYYRRVEREALERCLAEHESAVLATGGGIVTSPRTYRLLRTHTRTVWLKASAEDHWNRVVAQGDRRPMGENPHALAELRSLLAERVPLYAEAELVVDTSRLGVDGSVDAIAAAV